MAETLARFEAEEEERRALLEDPLAARQREDSRRAFAGIPAAEAQQLLLAAFGDVLGALNADMARTLGDAKLIRPLGTAGALIETEGRKQLLEGTGPVRTEESEGRLSKIDLTLENNGAAYEPANALVDLTIPASADEAVEIGDAGLEVVHAEGEGSSQGRPLGEMNVFYPEVQTDTDMLIAPLSTGVEFFDQLRSEESPEELRFDFDLPVGAQLKQDGNAAEVIAPDGSKLAVIPPPIAVDAQESSVPVQMEVEANALVLKVAHRDADFAYPILVDPIIQEWYWQNWYQGHNLHALSNGAWQWWTSEGSGSSYVYGDTKCILVSPCWGSGRGLYMDTPNGYLPPNRWGRWRYVAPNSETYLANAWVSPFWRDNHVNCPQSQYGQPYDYVGMYNDTFWNRVLYNKANDQGWVDIESWGRQLDIGMGTSSGISIPCWRDVMAGGVRIWLEDWSRPHLTTSTNSQWMDTAKIRLPVSAYDAGLGVKKFKATIVNKAGGTEEWWTDHSCTGLYEAPCPHTWDLGNGGQPELNFSPANMPEGIRKVNVTAYDAVDKPSFTTNQVDIRVDHAPPVITLSGTLTEQAALGTERLSYTIRADATDGNPASENPADARAGVTKLTFEIDGSLAQAPYEPGCASQSCSHFQELEVPASEMEAGPHILRVKAWDKYGHVATDELPFTTGDIEDPALTVQGGPAVSLTPTYSSSFGSEGEGNGEFDHPADVAVTTSGQLLVADSENDRIQRFDEDGGYLGQFGTTGEGNGQFVRPSGIEVAPDGDILVAEPGNDRIQRFDEDGKYLATIGSWGEDPGEFKNPEGIAVEPSGDIWVSDNLNDRVQKFSPQGAFIEAIGTSGEGKLDKPRGIDIGPAGEVVVADTDNERAVVFDSDGKFLDDFEIQGPPSGLDIDSLGNIWVADKNNEWIERFRLDGTFLGRFGTEGTGEGEFELEHPTGIATDSIGRIWVTDSQNNRMQRWELPGEEIGRFIEPISATAVDSGFGVVSISVQLIDSAGQAETVEETTQSCPDGSCSLSADFDELNLSERPPGPYTLAVVAEDAAGNTARISRLVGLDSEAPTIVLSGFSMNATTSP